MKKEVHVSSHEVYESIIRKVKIKNILKKVGVGVAVAGAGFVGYKIGLSSGFTKCNRILGFVLNDNPDIKDSFNNAWESSMNKIHS